MDTAVMDFPTAWAFIKASKPDDHTDQCHWRVTNGGMLCSCSFLWDEYARRKAARLEATNDD